MGSNNGRPLKAYVEEVQDEYDAAMAMRNRETSTQKDVLLEAQVESASKPSIMEQIADGQRREAVERKAELLKEQLASTTSINKKLKEVITDETHEVLVDAGYKLLFFDEIRDSKDVGEAKRDTCYKDVVGRIVSAVSFSSSAPKEIGIFLKA